MKRLIAALALTTCIGGAAMAQPVIPYAPPVGPAPAVAPAPIPPLPAPVEWSVRPTAEDLRAVYPKAAYDKGVSGRATLECLLQAGQLRDCRIVQERAEGYGFGAAAMSVAGKYRADTPDQLARVTIEWPHPTYEAAEARVAAGEIAALELLPREVMRWERRPGGDSAARYFPDRALRENLGGRAEVLCFIDIAGTLRSCVTVSESPADYGFGDAAARLARLMRVGAQTTDGRVTAGKTVRVPMAFNAPE